MRIFYILLFNIISLSSFGQDQEIYSINELRTLSSQNLDSCLKLVRSIPIEQLDSNFAIHLIKSCDNAMDQPWQLMHISSVGRRNRSFTRIVDQQVSAYLLDYTKKHTGDFQDVGNSIFSDLFGVIIFQRDSSKYTLLKQCFELWKDRYLNSIIGYSKKQLRKLNKGYQRIPYQVAKQNAASFAVLISKMFPDSSFTGKRSIPRKALISAEHRIDIRLPGPPLDFKGENFQLVFSKEISYKKDFPAIIDKISNLHNEYRGSPCTNILIYNENKAIFDRQCGFGSKEGIGYKYILTIVNGAILNALVIGIGVG